MAKYREMLNRAKDSAKYLVDESCDFQAAIKGNSQESWQVYLDQLDSLDASDMAHMEADSWDIVIYHHKALELVSDAWGSALSEAESSMEDSGFTFESFGQTCITLAYWLVYHAVLEAIESYVDEMREFAANMQENLES